MSRYKSVSLIYNRKKLFDFINLHTMYLLCHNIFKLNWNGRGVSLFERNVWIILFNTKHSLELLKWFKLVSGNWITETHNIILLFKMIFFVQIYIGADKEMLFSKWHYARILNGETLWDPYRFNLHKIFIKKKTNKYIAGLSSSVFVYLSFIQKKIIYFELIKNSFRFGLTNQLVFVWKMFQ